MSKLITTINSIAFSTEVDTITIASERDEQSVDLLITFDGLTVLDAHLDYPFNGLIAIDDISSLINRYLNGLSTMTISLDGNIVSVTDILPDTTDKGVRAVDYVATHFLVSGSCIKQTSLYSPEYLYYYALEDKTFNLNIEAYYSRDGSISSVSIESAITLTRGINKIEVSPDKYQDVDKGNLSSYTVSLGDLESSYTVITCDKPPTILLCKNRYKQLESLTLFGLVERDFSPTIKTATISGTRRNYVSEGRPVYKVSAGRLASDNYNQIQDLVLSDLFWLYCGSYTIEMYITDVELKTTDDDYSGTNCTVKFSPASNLSKRELTYQDGIFDETFDSTFN